jgi:hypothetical protein
MLVTQALLQSVIVQSERLWHFRPWRSHQQPNDQADGKEEDHQSGHEQGRLSTTSRIRCTRPDRVDEGCQQQRANDESFNESERIGQELPPF